MYGVVAALLIAYRGGRPLARMWRHRFVVVGTMSEGPGLTSVYVSGRRLQELDAEAGQFFMWRFLTREGWWQRQGGPLAPGYEGLG